MTEPERETHEITSKAEWLQWRRQDLTASAIAALFDAHPYLSRQPDNAAMRRGRIMEPGVAVAISEERPHWALMKANEYVRLPAYNIGATPDYYITSTDPAEPGRGVLEIKTTHPQRWEEWRAQPPLAYVLQALVQMMCTGSTWGWIATMVTSQSLPVYYTPVKRHAAAEERILKAAALWWAEYERGALAPAADAAGLAEMLDDGSSIDLSKDNVLPALLDEREMLKQAMTIETKRLGEIDYEIKNRIGKARSAWLPGWQLSYATSHRREVTIPAKDIRTLRVKRLREDDAEEIA